MKYPVKGTFDKTTTNHSPAPTAHSGNSRIYAVCVEPENSQQCISSNPRQERLNRETCRRTDVVGIYPDRTALIRLVGAVLAEQHDEWNESRRYLGLDLIQQSQAVGTMSEAGREQEDYNPDLALSA